MSYLECKGICKTFGTKVALDNVSIQAERGHIFALLGPNGSGKTTLIRIINKIINADKGEILIDGRLIEQKDIFRFAYLPEERGLYRKMKICDQLLFLAELKGMSRRDALQAFKMWFEKFNISDWWTKRVDELSKGMAQKVQFISSIVHNPELLILDEPFSGFDPVNADLIRKEIIELKKSGTSIILSTHNMASVEELADDIAIIHNSKLIEAGALTDIQNKYGMNNVEIVFDASQELSAHDNLFRILSSAVEINKKVVVLSLNEGVESNQLLKLLIEEGLRIKSYRELLPRMNDIFIKLVKES